MLKWPAFQSSEIRLSFLGLYGALWLR